MFIDEYLRALEASLDKPDWLNTDRPGRREQYVAQERFTREIIRRAEVFVCSPLTIETAGDLAQYQAPKLREHAQHMHLPAYETWVDFSAVRPVGGIGRRTAAIFAGDRSAKNVLSGEMIIVSDLGDGLAQIFGRFDLSRGVLFEPVPGDENPVEHYRKRGGNPEQLIAAVWSAICLINTPRLSILEPVDLTRLNKARARSGKPPLLQHKIVRIAIDRGEVGPSVSLPGGERALHHVRAFLRLKRGRVELVRPHWRGNPRFGVIKHRYVAFRAEDEAGPWMGGPPAPPQIIKEFVD